MRAALIPVITAVLGAGACESLPPEMTPAKLAQSNDLALIGLESDVAKALDRGLVELGPIDPDNATVIPVLPPRSGLYGGNNPMVPKLFKVYEQGGECWLLDETTSTFYRLENRTCVSLSR